MGEVDRKSGAGMANRVYFDGMGRHKFRVVFPSTHWTLIGRAGVGSEDAQQEALAELLRGYLEPLLSYLESTLGPDRADAADLLQDFIASQVLEKRLLAGVDRAKGRFRFYLLRALDNFIVSKSRHKRASRRMPAQGVTQVSSQQQFVSPDASPAAEFELMWARSVLGQAFERLKAECMAEKRPDLWRVFEGRMLVPMLGDAATPVGELAGELGVGAETVSNLLVTAKRRFKRALESVVARYELDGARVAEEIDDLYAIFASARKRERSHAYLRGEEEH